MLFAKAHVARLTSLVRTDKVEDKVGFKYFLLKICCSSTLPAGIWCGLIAREFRTHGNVG